MSANLDPHRRLPTDVVTAETDGDADPARFREVFRAQHRLSVGVFERPNHFQVSYSLGDIHRLTFLSHEERTAVEREWQAWHKRYVRLGRAGAIAWAALLAVAAALWLRGDVIAGTLQASAGVAVPLLWLRIAAAVIAGALLVTLPGFLASLSSSALADSYLKGYADGMTRGVNRALHITPEIEAEMWNELNEAQRADAAARQAVKETLT